MTSAAAANKVYLALDLATGHAAEPVVKQLAAQVAGFKVGSELFLAAGPAICDLILGLRADLFIDLKLYDIPRTVEAACKRLAKLGARFITVHASAGSEVLKAALEGAAAGKRTQILAVTVLTSHDDASLREIGVNEPTRDHVLRLAEVALHAGIPGLVSSAQEAALLREKFGRKPVLVTPGIRLSGGANHDQKRVATPGQALAEGADYLVIGRPVLEAKDRRAALAAIDQDIRQTLATVL